MQSQELASLESRLLDPLPIPIIGQCLQKRAAVALAEDRSPEAVKLLAKAVTRLQEPEIKTIILDILGKIRNQNKIDVVCEVWADTRHRDLANLLVQKSWVASTPIELRVITALKVNQPQTITNGGKEIVEPLLNAFKDRDTEIANRASECAIIFDKPEYQESLCRLVIEQDHPIARQVAIKAQYAPSEPSQKALFYFISEQWDKYETLDYEHSLLEKVYELGSEKLRKQIAEKVKQSGRAEWVQIIAGGRKGQRLEKMIDAEWEATLYVLSNNKQWEEMWRLAQKAPAVWSWKLLGNLKQVSWLPLEEEERVAFEKLKQLADRIGGIAVPPTLCQKSLTCHIGSVSGISFSPDGQLLAGCSRDKTIRLWQMPDGKATATLTGHADHIWKISFSPDGQLLASCSKDKTVRLWRMPDGKPTATLTGHTDVVRGISFSPDGQLLASYSRDETVRLWRMPDGKPTATLTGHTDGVRGISFSPDGQLLASYSEDKTIRLWRMPDGNRLATLTGHIDGVYGISFSPDGQFLASYDCKKTIRLWRMPNGNRLAALTGHTGSISGINFSPDGQLLASYSIDNNIRLWSSSASQLIRLPIKNLSQQNKKQVQELSQDSKITGRESNWIAFMQALINWHQRFDVEVEDAPQLVSTNEFDIEIEE